MNTIISPPLECLIDDNLATLQVYLEIEGCSTALRLAMENDRAIMKFDSYYSCEVLEPPEFVAQIINRHVQRDASSQTTKFWRDMYVRATAYHILVSQVKATPRFKELRTQVTAYAAASPRT